MSTPTSSRASQIGTTPGSGGRPGPTGTDAEPWWRSAVVYQIYPRSFFDADGDGTGDLRGITSHLDHVVSLGADAIWISPWYPSPMVDGGYDVADYCDIHPDFGTLDDAETLIDTARAKGLRVLIDLVPNHCSSQHPWFREAVAGGPGHPMRDWFVFSDGTGAHGELPPNNWPSVFGGAAWQRVVEPDGKPGQWYLHFFDPGQPDWNWDNEEVRAEFDRILRFWFDRGVDGFRVDVADALVKDMSLPDVPIDPRTGRGTLDKSIDNPMWDQPGLAEVQRRWRAIAAEYADTPGGERVFVAEAYLPHDRLVQFLAPDRFQMSFDFEFLQSAWDADSLRWVIDGCLAAHARTGSNNDEQNAGVSSRDDADRQTCAGEHVDASTATWVIGNHDVIRPATRYGKPVTGIDFRHPEDFDDIATKAMDSDVDLGRRRARAALLLEMALPGGAYVYQGEELGLDEVQVPTDRIEDPTWQRSGHVDRGRDGCRVPIPWGGRQAPYGWSTTSDTWLPMPDHWAELTVAAQDQDANSTLSLYRAVLAERRENPALGAGRMVWEDETSWPALAGVAEHVLVFRREPTLPEPASGSQRGADPRGGAGLRCVVNFGTAPVPLDTDTIIISSIPLTDGLLPRDAAAWVRL